MKKPNGAVTLSPEEAEGLAGLRARVAEIGQLAEIHPWLVTRNGDMTIVQVASRANTAVAVMLERAVSGLDGPLREGIVDVAVWLIHLAGYLNLDLVPAINTRVTGVKAESEPAGPEARA